MTSISHIFKRSWVCVSTSWIDDSYKRYNMKKCASSIIVVVIFTQKWNPFRWTSCSVDCIIKSHNCCFYPNVSDNIKMSCYLLCAPILCINRPHPSFYLLVMFHFLYCMSLSVSTSSTIYFRYRFQCFFPLFFANSDMGNVEVIAMRTSREHVHIHLVYCTFEFMHSRKKNTYINKIFKLFPLYFVVLT